MNKKEIKIISCLIVSILFNNTIRSQVYNAEYVKNGPVLLNEWRIIGPFAHPFQWSLYLDDLMSFKKNEATITYQELTEFNVDSLHGTFNKIIRSDNYLMNLSGQLGHKEDEDIIGNIYAACIICSEREEKVMLNFSANDCSKIWLNNIEIHNANVIYNNIRYYDEYIELDLKRGNNFLLVKIYNHDKDCGMFACLENWTKRGEKRHNADFIIRFDKKYLDRSIIENDSLCIAWFFPAQMAGKINIRGNGIDTTLNVTQKQKYISNISQLPNGLYKTIFYNHKEPITQNFYNGNLHEDIEEKFSELKNWQSPTTIKNNINAYEYRYRHLMKPENLPDKEYLISKWQRRMLYIYQGINEIYRYYTKEIEIPHNHINTYISKIDRGVQYYQLFLPDNHEPRDTLPLIIELPVPIKRLDSPLASWRFADIDFAEQFEGLANKYHVAILYAGARTIDIINGNNIDETDLWENINAVQKVVNVDTTRMYLRGACQAAFNALRLGTKYPDKWAAISILSPRLLTELDDNQWNKQNDPLKLLNNLWNVPILNMHSPLDKHTSIASSDYFTQTAKKYKFSNYEFVNLNLEFKEYYSSEYMYETFEFFLKHTTKERDKDKIKFSTYELKNNKAGWITILSMKEEGELITVDCKINRNKLDVHTTNTKSFSIDLNQLPYKKNEKLLILHNNTIAYEGIATSKEVIIESNTINELEKNFKTEGPFAHLFNDSFIIVQGTTGTKEDLLSQKNMIELLQKKWNELYYTQCRVKCDSEITPDDIKTHHLLLLGNAKSNRLIRKYQASLPIIITKKAITINKQAYQGDDLSFYMIYPNPENAQRYVGLLGYNNATNFSLHYEHDLIPWQDISHLGWYDFRVWNTKGKELCTKNFNLLWK